MFVTKDATDITTYFHLRLTADGTDATGLTVTNFDLQYVRSGATAAAKVDASALGAANSAHADNSAIEVDVTDQPGLYRVDWPDAAFATGVDWVYLTVKCATAFTETLRVQLISATRGLAGTALPNAAADAAGGLPISDAGGLDLDAKIGALTYGTANRVNAQVYGMEAATVTAAAIATGAIDADALAADAITDAKVASDVTIASVTGAVGSVTGAVGSVTGAVGSVTGAVGSVTGNVGGNVTGSVGSVVSFGTLVSDIWAAVVDSAGVTTLLSRISATRAGYLDNLSAGAVATAAKLLSYFQSALRKDVTVDADIGGAYDDATDSQEAIRDRGDAAWTTATGFSTLSQADVRTAVGLASANLDTQLDALPTAAENAAAAAAQVTSDHGAGSYVRNTEPLDAAGTRTAVGLASANLDTQFDALPTAAENATAVAAAVTSDHGAGSYIRNTEPLDAAGTRSAVGLASANLDTQLDALPTAAENADKYLGRNLAGGSDGGRTVRDALRPSRNKVVVDVDGNITVYAENDFDIAWVGVVTRAAGDPLTSVDPA